MTIKTIISETRTEIEKELAFMESMSETPRFDENEAMETLEKLKVQC